MLSVRNLAKIAAKKRRKSVIGLSPAELAAEEARDAAASPFGETLSPYGPSGTSRPGNRPTLRYQAIEGSPAAALESAPAEEAETHRECKSPSEMYADLVEKLEEARRAGVHYLIGFILLIYTAVRLLNWMVAYLITVCNLDLPEVPSFADAIFDFATVHPILFLVLNFGLAFAIGTLFLFLEDIRESYREMRAARLRRESVMAGTTAYQRLQEMNALNEERKKDEADEDLEAGSGPHGKRKPNFAELLKQLRRVTDEAEELEIKTRVLYPTRGKNNSSDALEARQELKDMQQRRDELRRLVSGSNDVPEPVDAELEHREPTILSTLLGSAIVSTMTRSVNGILSVSLYFADLFSDLQVAALLLETGNMLWAGLSIALLALQFIIVQLRVMPYLRSTHGSQSVIYISFVIFGFPTGLLILDALMFMEPFGLLAILPFPDWLRQFLPAYKATRIIAEVVIESLPQCFLQSYIYIVVLANAKAGTATPSQLAMLDYTAVLPTSIFISTIAMLKMWIEVVNGARSAGLTIMAKAVQLWEVGAGLPLDALKKGAIVEWSCPYLLEGPEVSPLLDALGRNSSLVRLDLSRSGLIWSGPSANGTPLLENMSQTPSVLSGLKTMVISDSSHFKIPVGQLRKGGDTALEALRAAPFFRAGGPRREEVLFIGELMRRNVLQTLMRGNAAYFYDLVS